LSKGQSRNSKKENLKKIYIKQKEDLIQQLKKERIYQKGR